MLQARSLSKSFGETIALSGVSLDFAPGEIHAVIGENGAGKSTLMNLLGGHLRPTSGQVVLSPSPREGEVREQSERGGGNAFQIAAEARAHGIEMVHQHFMLVPNLTVRENLDLACQAVRGSTDQLLQRASDLGWKFDPSAYVRELSVGEQQRLEITKCLRGSARFLILDEPTAVLTPLEVEGLFDLLRELAKEGLGIILIAHKLREVLAVADQISVLRHGKWVGTTSRDGASEAQLSEWMLGEGPQSQARTPETSQSGRAYEVRGLTLTSGHILGIGGVDGNGQQDLAEDLALSWGPPEGVTLGYVPPDRQHDGLALDMTLEENLLIGTMDAHFRPLLDFKALRTGSARAIEEFDVRSSGPAATARSLSGGNQQKVVLARVLARRPDILVVVNPTRGLDFGATQFVRDQIRHAAQEGTAIVLFSTDADELAELADTTLYMSRGELKESLQEAVR